MTTANLKGGFVKTLTISRDGSSSNVSILKNTFLKKTSNYVLQMRNFITNITPPLSPPLGQNEPAMFTILPKGGLNIEVQAVDHTAEWLDEAWYTFNPTPHFSVLGLALQMRRFFHRFSWRVRNLGSLRMDPTDGANHPKVLPYMKTNYTDPQGQPPVSQDRGYAAPAYADDGQDHLRLVEFSVLADGAFQLRLHPEFSSNFYIELSARAAELTGLEQFVFVTTDGNGDTHTGGTENLFATNPAGNLVFTNDYPVVVTRNFKSLYSLASFDRRVSLDVVATFPLSNSIFFGNGKEQHDFILARFPLSDYKRLDATVTTEEDQLRSEVILEEDVNIGLEDLARGNPNVTSVYLLPGDIRQVNLQLWTRYLRTGSDFERLGLVERVKTDMEYGFWSTKLLFSKKQT